MKRIVELHVTQYRVESINYQQIVDYVLNLFGQTVVTKEDGSLIFKYFSSFNFSKGALEVKTFNSHKFDLDSTDHYFLITDNIVEGHDDFDKLGVLALNVEDFSYTKKTLNLHYTNTNTNTNTNTDKEESTRYISSLILHLDDTFCGLSRLDIPDNLNCGKNWKLRWFPDDCRIRMDDCASTAMREFEEVYTIHNFNISILRSRLEKIKSWLDGHDDISDHGQQIRSFHNFFGWMAMKTEDKLGGCSGTLYRSKKFMKIPIKDRVGTKINQNIHIEHTIPVSIIKDVLLAEYREANSEKSIKRIYDILLKYSVCCAVDFATEKDAIDSNGWRSSHPSFKKKGGSWRVVDDFPFKRYFDSGVEVYSMLDGQVIDLSRFTFENHLENLQKVSVFTDLRNSL